jgi:hypothetical protein
MKQSCFTKREMAVNKRPAAPASPPDHVLRRTRDLKHPAYTPWGAGRTKQTAPDQVGPRRDNANDDGEGLILQHLPIETRLKGRFGDRVGREMTCRVG